MSEKFVALLCECFYPDAISTGLHMTELSAGLSERGWRIRAYCGQPASASEALRPSRETYQDVEIRRVQRHRAQARGIVRRAIGAAKYVVASLCCLIADRRELGGVLVTTNPPFVGTAAILMRILFGTPYAMLVYDVYPDIAIGLGVLRRKSFLAKVWELVSCAILNRASVIIVIGRDMEAVIRGKTGPHARIVVIPNWADGSRVRAVDREENPFRRDRHRQGKLIVQYAGNIGRIHDVEAIVDAAKELRHDSQVLFQFVGDGAKRGKLKRLVREAGLSNVQFLPYQPLSELGAMLSAADLGLVSLGEEFTGLSVPSRSYAIMAAGVPILALVDPASEIGRMVADERCGQVVWPVSGHRIAAALRHILSDPNRLRAMGANGRRALVERYDLRLAVERYDGVLQSVVGTYARGAAPCQEQREGSELASA